MATFGYASVVQEEIAKVAQTKEDEFRYAVRTALSAVATAHAEFKKAEDKLNQAKEKLKALEFTPHDATIYA